MFDMIEVVAALIWRGNKFMICQRPAHKARGLLRECVGGKAKHNDIKWITPSEISNYEFCPADKEILNKLLQSNCD